MGLNSGHQEVLQKLWEMAQEKLALIREELGENLELVKFRGVNPHNLEQPSDGELEIWSCPGEDKGEEEFLTKALEVLSLYRSLFLEMWEIAFDYIGVRLDCLVISPRKGRSLRPYIQFGIIRSEGDDITLIFEGE